MKSCYYILLDVKINHCCYEHCFMFAHLQRVSEPSCQTRLAPSEPSALRLHQPMIEKMQTMASKPDSIWFM